MLKIIKKNYELIYCIFLLALILIISIYPQKYMLATYKGIVVWAKIVLPSLFVFFILTKFLQQNKKAQLLFGKCDFIFKKLYNIKSPHTSYIFFMSIISGYPIGAKLVSEFYISKQISYNDAKKIITFTSTSGPMFILGSVASSMVFNAQVGIIILISHLLASLINGLLYRNINSKKIKKIKPLIKTKKPNKYNEQNALKKNFSLNNIKQKSFKNKCKTIKNVESKNQSLNEIMLNTITSVFMIGGFIALSFTLIELIFSLNIFYPIEKLLNIFSPSLSKIFIGIISGIFEVTSGCLIVSTLGVNLKIITIILTALISFGGLSIHLQSNIFLSKCNIKYKFFLLSKITHSIISVFISGLLSIILL